MTFAEESPSTTRVVLVHRGLEAYGERAAEMRETFESGGGWGLLLDLYAARAAV